MEVYRQEFLTSALGDEWSVTRHGRFIPGERDPCTRWIESWVGPRAGLNATEKTSQPRRELTKTMKNLSLCKFCLRRF